MKYSPSMFRSIWSLCIGFIFHNPLWTLKWISCSLKNCSKDELAIFSRTIARIVSQDFIDWIHRLAEYGVRIFSMLEVKQRLQYCACKSGRQINIGFMGFRLPGWCRIERYAAWASGLRLANIPSTPRTCDRSQTPLSLSNDSNGILEHSPTNPYARSGSPVTEGNFPRLILNLQKQTQDNTIRWCESN